MRTQKGIWILSLCGVLLASSAGIADSRPGNIHGYLIAKTPYDQKTALREVLASRYISLPVSGREPLEEIFFKARRIVYRKDPAGDHWQTPAATEKKRTGDCEDKALWLYDSLKKRGYDSLRIVIGKYRHSDKKLHVWLMREDKSGNIFILDPANQDKVWDIRLLETGFYKPLFSFDGEKRYCHLETEKFKGSKLRETPDRKVFSRRFIFILREMATKFFN